MNELLLHEAGLGALPGGLGGAGPSTASSSSKSPTPGGELHRESSSSEGEEEEKGGWAPAQAIPENSGDESSDEEFTMKVGFWYLWHCPLYRLTPLLKLPAIIPNSTSCQCYIAKMNGTVQTIGALSCP